MKGKVFGVIVLLIVLAGVTLLVVNKWDSISSIWGGKGLKGCKDLSPFDCVKKHGAIKTTSTSAGDRYDYPGTRDGAHGFYSNNRAVLIGSSPALKGSYDKTEITWDNGNKTPMNTIFK